MHLLHDVHHRLTPIEAGRLGRSLEPYHLFWLEDPTPAEEQARFRLIRQHTTTPLAVGEIFNSIHDCSQLISEQLIDYIRTTVVRAGGISHLRKISMLAELYQVRTGSHGATDLSPVCMAAALHVDLSVHNFGIQEYMRHTEETDRVFPHAYRFTTGSCIPATSRAWGSRSTRRWRRSIPTSAPICQSIGCWMGRCTVGRTPRFGESVISWLPPSGGSRELASFFRLKPEATDPLFTRSEFRGFEVTGLRSFAAVDSYAKRRHLAVRSA